jgi:hypothetical protein
MTRILSIIGMFRNRAHLLWAAHQKRLYLSWSAHYSKVTGKPLPSGFSYTVYDSMAELPVDAWDQVNARQDIFLSSSYLQTLEQAPPKNMSFRYAIVSDNAGIIGIVYFQIIRLDDHVHRSIKKFLKIDEKPGTEESESKGVEKAGIRLLVCGNAMLSGEHGFCFRNVPTERTMQVIAEIAYDIRTSFPGKIAITLVKDFYRQTGKPLKPLRPYGFSSFDAGPNMVVPIRPNWSTFEAYLNDMKPKYRKRAEGAIKKGKPIARRPLSLEEIILRSNELYDLYCRVADNAKFRIFSVSPDYFAELKRKLGDKFECVGFFINNEMIGFTTRIYNSGSIEGYIHGMRYEQNKSYELYQNILLDDVRAAITAGMPVVNTGRTSIAMKSSMGAVPKNMDCYMRFSGKISNQIFSHVMYFIKHSSESARNPFKE